MDGCRCEFAHVFVFVVFGQLIGRKDQCLRSETTQFVSDGINWQSQPESASSLLSTTQLQNGAQLGPSRKVHSTASRLALSHDVEWA